MFEDIKAQVLQQFHNFPFFELQLDELTDISEQAQFLVFIHIFTNKDIVENFLCCKICLETIKGEEIFEIVDHYLKSSNLLLDKCIGASRGDSLNFAKKKIKIRFLPIVFYIKKPL